MLGGLIAVMFAKCIQCIWLRVKGPLYPWLFTSQDRPNHSAASCKQQSLNLGLFVPIARTLYDSDHQCLITATARSNWPWKKSPCVGRPLKHQPSGKLVPLVSLVLEKPRRLMCARYQFLVKSPHVPVGHDQTVRLAVECELLYPFFGWLVVTHPPLMILNSPENPAILSFVGRIPVATAATPASRRN